MLLVYFNQITSNLSKPKSSYDWQTIVAEGEAGFEQLFKSFYAILFGIGYRMCANAELVKDTIQSFFLYLWEKRFQLQEIENLDAYLKTAFRRKMQDVLKNQQRQNRQIQSVPIQESTPSYETLLVHLQQVTEQQNKLKKVLADLPEQQKKVLEWRFLEGLSYDEIAEQTGKSRQTIYNQVHAAIKKIRAALQSKK
ncbi:MAG: sigma-70 family RNA polymerase sigma factor [Bacteroidota bacterium]